MRKRKAVLDQQAAVRVPSSFLSLAPQDRRPVHEILLRALGVLLLLALAGGAWLATRRIPSLPPRQKPRAARYFDAGPPGRVWPRSARGWSSRVWLPTPASLTCWPAIKNGKNRLQAGRFALNTGWLPEQVLDELVNGHPVLYRVTVPEGLTWWQTARCLKKPGLVVLTTFARL